MLGEIAKNGADKPFPQTSLKRSRVVRVLENEKEIIDSAGRKTGIFIMYNLICGGEKQPGLVFLCF